MRFEGRNEIFEGTRKLCQEKKEIYGYNAGNPIAVGRIFLEKY